MKIIIEEIGTFVESRSPEEIKEFDLNYDFLNINELYIENYKRVDWRW